MKIAMIAMRYGKEVNGGAELLCRLIAEQMQKHWDVEVLTTCALDYMTWRNEYAPGLEIINGVKVRRFPNDVERDVPRFNHYYEKLAKRHQSQGKPRGLFAAFIESVFGRIFQFWLERFWMYLQGPRSTALTKYLQAHRNEYDACIFVTYCYATTYYNIPLVRDKAYIIPAAHDDLCFYFDLFKRPFKLARGLIYSTPEERSLVEQRFPFVSRLPHRITGIGVDSPPKCDSESFRRKFIIEGPYVIYVGRIEPGKGCVELFDFFQRYVADTGSQLQLVLLGKAVMEIPQHPQIRALGFVSETDKYAGLSGAECLIMPSPYESLSIVLLEAWMSSIPVLVTATCDVLKAQTTRSQGGLWYKTYEDFKDGINTLIGDRQRAESMASSGRAYTEKTYKWSKIESDYLSLISKTE